MVNQQNRVLTMMRIKKSISLFYFDKWTKFIIRLFTLNLSIWNELRWFIFYDSYIMICYDVISKTSYNLNLEHKLTKHKVSLNYTIYISQVYFYL